MLIYTLLIIVVFLVLSLVLTYYFCIKNFADKLSQIKGQVDNKLDNNFTHNHNIFTTIINNLSKIDAAQKNIEHLSQEVLSLQDILSGNKKARGIFGEVQLKQILFAVFGNNNKLYQLEYTLQTNHKRCDAIVFAPQPLGSIVIDAKFPLENYQKLQDNNLPLESRNNYEKMFKNDLKAHIDKISTSYLIAGETAEHGIMFIPAEAIFAYLHAYCADIVVYAYSKNIWITAPTTLMATLSTIQLVIKEHSQQQNFANIKVNLKKLATEFIRYDSRWLALMKSIEKLSTSAQDIEITKTKIYKQFQQITDSDD